MLASVKKITIRDKITIGTTCIVACALFCTIFFSNVQMSKQLHQLQQEYQQLELEQEQHKLQQLSHIVYHIFQQQYLSYSTLQEHQTEAIINNFDREISSLVLPKQAFVTVSTVQGILLYHSLQSTQQSLSEANSDTIPTAMLLQLYQRASTAESENMRYDAFYPTLEEQGITPIFVHSQLLSPLNLVVACHINGFHMQRAEQFEKCTTETWPSQFLFLFSLASIVCLGVIALSIRLFLSYKLKQLQALELSMQQLSEGTIEQNTFQANNHDEIGFARLHFNTIAQNVCSMTQQIEQTKSEFTAIDHILKQRTNSLSHFCLKQEKELKETNNRIEAMSEQMKLLLLKIVEVLNIKHQIQQRMQQGTQITQAALQKIELLKSNSKKHVMNVRSLSEKMHNIADIIKSINGIASQSKMIAFNAELEASAAGEAGRNFKIVAMEIRRLSDNILEATNGIKQSVLETQEMIDHIVLASEESVEEIQDSWQQFHELMPTFSTSIADSQVSTSILEQSSNTIQSQLEKIHIITQSLMQLAREVQQLCLSYTIDESTKKG